jgi:class 3 adenylate cyclase/heme/copper-type cytochrome/quinol oxidase subunit 2
MSRRLLVFLIVFTIINLIFVPLLSLYGLRVCPVLSIPGFGFGCYYSGVFIFISNLVNFIFIYFIRSKREATRHFLLLSKNRIWLFVGAYLIATAISLMLLQVLLKVNHLTSHSRGPEILALASLMLGMTQAYGLNWALYGESAQEDSIVNSSLKKLWGFHIARILLPVCTVAGVLLHFLISQSQVFNNGSIAPLVSHDDLIEQTSYVVSFLLVWLVITLSFHFLSEKDQLQRIQKHLERLEDLDFGFRTDLGESWGLWAGFINQLNSFSRVLGERTRLLKSFSRFVTAGVAEKALHQELKETTGIVRDLTVIMSDIRNFTGISESLTPNQVVTLLNEYFNAMLDVISRYSVYVDKFIGDGILAYVDLESEGLSIPENENQLGVDAALGMIRRVEQLNIKLKAMGLPDIKIGIGIYRGPLIIGLIGTEAKLQHTIIGDTVNRTARLEGLCKDLQVSIVISGNVWRSLSREVRAYFKPCGKQLVKGVTEAIEVFGGPI